MRNEKDNERKQLLFQLYDLVDRRNIRTVNKLPKAFDNPRNLETQSDWIRDLETGEDDITNLDILDMPIDEKLMWYIVKIASPITFDVPLTDKHLEKKNADKVSVVLDVDDGRVSVRRKFGTQTLPTWVEQFCEWYEHKASQRAREWAQKWIKAEGWQPPRENKSYNEFEAAREKMKWGEAVFLTTKARTL
jgi:hypothetical protein